MKKSKKSFVLKDEGLSKSKASRKRCCFFKCKHGNITNICSSVFFTSAINYCIWLDVFKIH